MATDNLLPIDTRMFLEGQLTLDHDRAATQGEPQVERTPFTPTRSLMATGRPWRCQGGHSWPFSAIRALALSLAEHMSRTPLLTITYVIVIFSIITMLAIGIYYIPVFARLTRASALTVKGLDYIDAARVAGQRELTIIRRHVLPNILSPLIIQATIQFAVAILAEAGLSYLGLGTQPPHASWGRMLNEAQTFMELAPWMALFPGLAIAWAVLGFNLLGDGLRDILDPRLR